jgi:hypothetical protein
MCDGSCSDELACFSESGKPPGECVPHCSSDPDCPGGYVCRKDLGVCTHPAPARGSSGCHVAAARSSRRAGPSAAWFVAVLAWLRCRVLRARK